MTEVGHMITGVAIRCIPSRPSALLCNLSYKVVSHGDPIL